MYIYTAIIYAENIEYVFNNVGIKETHLTFIAMSKS